MIYLFIHFLTWISQIIPNNYIAHSTIDVITFIIMRQTERFPLWVVKSPLPWPVWFSPLPGRKTYISLPFGRLLQNPLPLPAWHSQDWWTELIQYIPRNMHTVFALLCFVVVIHWLIFPSPSGLLHWHCGNLTIAPVPVKQPWWIWINTSCEFIMNDCITTTKQSTTKPCAYFLGYTVRLNCIHMSQQNTHVS